MASLKKFSAEVAIGDLTTQMNQDYNVLIRKILKRLATKKRSPVWTGFFASSWTAAGVPIVPKDKVESYQPWANIKRKINSAPVSERRRLAKSLGRIEPRFTPTNTFDMKRAVFIGNRAEYSLYALESGKVQYFVQGEIGRLIQETMTDKGKTFIGGSFGEGSFGQLAGQEYIRYTEF